MKVMIVEDEGIAARRLQKLVEKEGLEVIMHCKSNQEINNYLDKHEEPELYFMDIHLSDGIVFELLQNRTLQSPIIFTTAYDEYAIKAFKQNSIDYILKPIDPKELQKAIEKFKKLHHQEAKVDMLALSQLLMSQSSIGINYRDRIRVKIGDRIKSIPLHDVTHVYSDQKVTYLHTIERRSYPIDYALDAIVGELDPKKFYRVNRSHIVSIDHIADVISFSNSRLKIKMKSSEAEDIIVARERVKEFKAWLG